ncbi:predicted protein [Nematostella vectensis]|uniref:mRNA export factor GLE1 n=1 Tax=Nematostella vectensis TaxID=45351 RepID=A7SHN5_NEMVE|nr:predicted protein [Nematostella vectensis]|eukprot:XP_001628829.1 predicted protein [Nematostella vectensis]
MAANEMDVLQGLKQSSKGKLNYDLQPTKQELIEPCTTPLIIGIEYENVLQKFQNATSSSSSPTVKEASKTEGHPRSNEKPKKNEFLANASNDRSMTMYNLNYSMRTDYKKTTDISHVLLRSREKEKAEEVNERAKKRALMYKYHEEKLKEDKRLNLQKQQEELRNKILEDVQALQEDERNKTLQVRNKQREVEIEHREYAARAERKMREVEERQRLIAEEERNRQELAQLCSKHHEIHALVQKLDEAVKQCKYADYLPETTKTFLQESSKVFSLSQNTVKASVDMGRPAENAARLLDEYIGMLKVLLNKGMTAVAEAEQKGIKEKAETEAKKQEEEERKRDEEKKKAERAAAEARKKKEKAKSVPEYLVDCTSDSAFKEYTRLEKLLEKTEKEIEPLASSKEKDMKKLKLELQKAVTTPINTISDTSPSHLLEKIQTLKELLNGRAVTNTGKTISLSSHPLASLYCKNMLAKKIVQQGSGQVSSNHSAAFPSAAVAIDTRIQAQERNLTGSSFQSLFSPPVKPSPGYIIHQPTTTGEGFRIIIYLRR